MSFKITLLRLKNTRKSYILTHHCVSAETLGSSGPTWVRKDPKVLVETQWWVKRYRSSFKITLLLLKITRKSYLLTHHCVPAETLGSFSPTWVRKDPKVLVETQRWVKRYRSSFKITLLGLKNTRKSYLLTPPLPFNENQKLPVGFLVHSYFFYVWYKLYDHAT
jgi:hypothetical protein